MWMQRAMLPLRDLSFRYRIPLRGSVLVVVTAVAVTASLIFREYDDLKQDLIANSTSLGRLLASTLVTPLTHDDVWRAFEIVNSPLRAPTGADSSQGAEFILVLDPRGRVYVSTQPTRYPVLSEPGQTDPDFQTMQVVGTDDQGREPRSIERPGSDRIFVLAPILADDIMLGTLVMGYSKGAFLPRYLAIAKRAALVTLLVIAILIPASWYWAQRFAAPMVALARSMGQIAERIPDDDDIQVDESRNELGQVGRAFKRMVKELREKKALEREMIQSERLAAVGRLSAVIAHEINNPLGGMLNAIDTFKHHGKIDPVSARTISLIERGLRQIKNTVAALLVEAKVESHALTREDIEDARTLIQPDAQRKGAALDWQNDLIEDLPLPSTLVRQVLINLLLNAVQAVREGGSLACKVYRDSANLHVVVRNDGAHIPPERMQRLFEPFSADRGSAKEGGHGLGLWVTYQIVTQLGGDISVDSAPGDTRFAVRLPLPIPTA
jgi:signal transduction histidine kinase